MQIKLTEMPLERVNMTVAIIEDTKYLLLNDGTPVTPLKPTVINGKDYFNFIIEGKMKRVSRENLINNISKK